MGIVYNYKHIESISIIDGLFTNIEKKDLDKFENLKYVEYYDQCLSLRSKKMLKEYSQSSENIVVS